MQKKIKIFLPIIIAIILCVPAQAQDYLSIEEAIDIILDSKIAEKEKADKLKQI